MLLHLFKSKVKEVTISNKSTILVLIFTLYTYKKVNFRFCDKNLVDQGPYSVFLSENKKNSKTNILFSLFLKRNEMYYFRNDA